MRIFDDTIDDTLVARFAAQLESALLAQALAANGGLPDGRAKALMRDWLIGVFNGSVAALPTIERGALAWEPDREGHRLTWYMPSGIACPLARLHQQEDGTWAALIVAGVRCELIEAMAAAEWRVSRLIATNLGQRSNKESPPFIPLCD